RTRRGCPCSGHDPQPRERPPDGSPLSGAPDDMPDEPAGQRLQLKPGQSVSLINCPRALQRTLLADVTPLRMIQDPSRADAVICFVIRLAELDEIASPFVEAARRDALAW